MNYIMRGLKLAEKKEQLLKEAKFCMVQFWANKGMSRHELLITDVSIKLSEKEYTIVVTLERPGLLIGKAGKDINDLQKKLTEYLGHPTKIKIIEDKQWCGIYNLLEF